jgi:hypothetical protein
VIAFIVQRKVNDEGRKEGRKTVFGCTVDTAGRTLTLNLDQGVTRLLLFTAATGAFGESVRSVLDSVKIPDRTVKSAKDF